MEKETAVKILQHLAKQIQEEEITLPCINFYEQIKKENLCAITMGIEALNKEEK